MFSTEVLSNMRAVVNRLVRSSKCTARREQSASFFRIEQCAQWTMDIVVGLKGGNHKDLPGVWATRPCAELELRFVHWSQLYGLYVCRVAVSSEASTECASCRLHLPLTATA